MRNGALLITAVLICGMAFSKAVQGNGSQTWSAAECEAKYTITMCIVKGMWATRKRSPVAARQVVHARSAEFQTVITTDNWFEIAPGKSELVLIDDSARAVVDIGWREGERGDHRSVARQQETLSYLANQLNGEPMEIPVAFGQFAGDGTLFRLCYFTKRETQECLYSAAADLPGGMVTAYAVSDADAELNQQVFDIISSIHTEALNEPMGDDPFAIHYASAQDARDALERDSSAGASSADGWTTFTIEKDDGAVIWTFPSPESPAYPAVVKQIVIVTDEAIDIKLRVLCEAARPACNQLEEEYEQLNARMIGEAMRGE